MKNMVAKVKAGKTAKRWANTGTTNQAAASASKSAVGGSGSGYLGGHAAGVMKAFCKGKKK